VRIKRRGFSGTKGFVFPLIKPVCSSFMMSSVPHEIAAHEGAVPVPFHHKECGAPSRITSSSKGASAHTGSGSASTNTFLQAARHTAHSGRKQNRQGEEHEDSPADVAAQTRDGRSGEAALAAGAVAARGARPVPGESTRSGLVTRWAPRTCGQAIRRQRLREGTLQMKTQRCVSCPWQLLPLPRQHLHDVQYQSRRRHERNGSTGRGR
jgi:hypothetical protein